MRWRALWFAVLAAGCGRSGMLGGGDGISGAHDLACSGAGCGDLGDMGDDPCADKKNCPKPECVGDRRCHKPGTEVCNNGIDDDDDGLVDCQDPDCKTFPGCAPHMCDAQMPDC